MDKKSFSAYHCPRWDELPAIALYMDQVLIIIDEAARPLVPEEESTATATMINNYVKIKLILPSEKKKYTREHIARLIMISLLKRVLSMTELELLLRFENTKQEYDIFCQTLERHLAEAFSLESTGGDTSPCSPLMDAAIQTLVCKLRFEVLAEKSIQQQ